MYPASGDVLITNLVNHSISLSFITHQSQKYCYVTSTPYPPVIHSRVNRETADVSTENTSVTQGEGPLHHFNPLKPDGDYKYQPL
jgi:hypothetical protein